MLVSKRLAPCSCLLGLLHDLSRSKRTESVLNHPAASLSRQTQSGLLISLLHLWRCVLFWLLIAYTSTRDTELPLMFLIFYLHCIAAVVWLFCLFSFSRFPVRCLWVGKQTCLIWKTIDNPLTHGWGHNVAVCAHHMSFIMSVRVLSRLRVRMVEFIISVKAMTPVTFIIYSFSHINTHIRHWDYRRQVMGMTGTVSPGSFAVHTKSARDSFITNEKRAWKSSNPAYFLYSAQLATCCVKWARTLDCQF